MKLRRLTWIVLALCPAFMLAQPTFTQDWLGKPGEFTAAREASEIPDWSASGADVSWDFSGVTPADTAAFGQLYVIPDTTPFFSDFAGATHCQFTQYIDEEFGPIKSYVYSKATSANYVTAGRKLTTSMGAITTTYADPETLIEFPLTYQSQFSDTYHGTRNLAGLASTQFAGEVTIDADSYGTVELPGGTFPNCLRVKSVTDHVDTTDLGLGITEETHVITTTYLWISLAHPGPIASYSEVESYAVAIIPPLPPDTSETAYDTSFSWDPTAVSSGARYFQPEAYTFEANPNPFNDYLTLSFALEKPEEMRFELQTINGQLVFTQVIPGIQGLNTETIEPGSLPPGTYVAVLRGKEKAGIRTVIKVE